MIKSGKILVLFFEKRTHYIPFLDAFSTIDIRLFIQKHHLQLPRIILHVKQFLLV